MPVVTPIPRALQDVLHALEIRARRSSRARWRRWDTHLLDKTRNRSVVGIMNEFSYLGEAWRHASHDLDLVASSDSLIELRREPLAHSDILPASEAHKWDVNQTRADPHVNTVFAPGIIASATTTSTANVAAHRARVLLMSQMSTVKMAPAAAAAADSESRPRRS